MLRLILKKINQERKRRSNRSSHLLKKAKRRLLRRMLNLLPLHLPKMKKLRNPLPRKLKAKRSLAKRVKLSYCEIL
jgi:hypothetical protein